jgi:hypothetical protein
MIATAKELQSFTEFVTERLQDDKCHATLDELFSEWRIHNPTPDEIETNVRAVRASLHDMDRGETGRPFEDFAAEFRRRNGI